MAPSVSVVVTCYNYARFLDPCIPSVLAQSHGDLEVILVNDGSTDATREVAARWADEPRFRYVEQANAGQVHAKNVGIAHARGEHIAFLDADDYWHPRKLERQLPLLAKPGVGVVYSRASYVDDLGRDNAYVLDGLHLRPRRGTVSEYLLFDNFIPFSSAIVRRECFERCGSFDESLAMAIDWDLWLRISLEFAFDYVDEPLLYYRMGHPDQMSLQQEIRFRCCDRILENFLGSNPGRMPDRTVRHALAYACSNRGHFYESRNRFRAWGYYLRSLRHRPLQVGAYKGMVRAALPRSSQVAA